MIPLATDAQKFRDAAGALHDTGHHWFGTVNVPDELRNLAAHLEAAAAPKPTLAEAAEAAAGKLEAFASLAESWVSEGQTGGWSTHQVMANRAHAEYCRIEARALRAALSREEAKS